ncbi:MAG: type II toxin-antitoxin system VapC family toxin [Alphaproteobacteria bacterium]|nr:type II toxin-antitoxin system VapC family toxin [Alphaproteobacteria bacterium]MBV9694919.1 type II toxin-antitoxin system VapC family toxin [Alphaproteobacteria bacterium]
MYLLDTCVISEGSRTRPDGHVDSWFAAQNQNDLYLSAISVGELHFGIERLVSGRKRNSLRNWLAETVIVGFAERIVPFDLGSSLRWGDLRARHPNAKTADTQIAAIALAFGFTLVTRNVRDFGFDGLVVLNPWRT